MVRPHIRRFVGMSPQVRYFKPRGVPLSELDEVVLTEDGLEAVRLVDLEGLYQDAAAQKMGVSRQTIGRILETARKAISDALISGKAIRIEGGHVQINAPAGRPRFMCRGRRGRGWNR